MQARSRPNGESLLIVQANHEWSVDRYDEPPEANCERLAALTADLLDDERLREPDWTDYQGWRYALPEDGVARDPFQLAEAEGYTVSATGSLAKPDSMQRSGTASRSPIG